LLLIVLLGGIDRRGSYCMLMIQGAESDRGSSGSLGDS